MPIRPETITSILRRHMEEFQPVLDVEELGSVLSAGDGIARIHGLDRVMAGELVEFPDRPTVSGLALNLDRESVGVALLGDVNTISEGDTARRTGRIVSLSVGPGLLGRVMDSLGAPLDGKGPISGETLLPVEAKAPAIMDRMRVTKPLYTGLKAIDSLNPIGRGQRELIIGDRRTGKTSLALDTIINQRQSGVRCVYVAIGQQRSSLAQVIARLEEYKAMDHTVVVAATASDPATLQYLAPYTGFSVAEYFRDRGEHSLIILDDLSRHAISYRELSLLLRRPAGREAYPGDIFYLHGRLLERAANLGPARGGGSLTALPIVETLSGDFTAAIPTNLISISDGQIVLDADLFRSGFRPAIHVGLSMSRVGGAAQTGAMKGVATSLRAELVQRLEVASVVQFDSDLDEKARKKLIRGDRLREVLKQSPYSPMPIDQQLLVLLAVTRGFLDPVPLEEVSHYERGLFAHMEQYHPQILARLREETVLSDSLESDLMDSLREFGRKLGTPTSMGEPTP